MNMIWQDFLSVKMGVGLGGGVMPEAGEFNLANGNYGSVKIKKSIGFGYHCVIDEYQRNLFVFNSDRSVKKSSKRVFRGGGVGFGLMLALLNSAGKLHFEC